MLWVFLPAYNEEKSLPRFLPKLNQFALSKGWAYRVVVVDDGSRDDTAKILAQFKATLPIEVVEHPINRGLGETERDGFEFIAARCEPSDIIIRFDADDTHEPEYMQQLINKLDEGYDVVSASRFQKGGSQLGVNGYRTVISLAANLFMRMVFSIPGIKDYSCGYRAYRGQVIQDAVRAYGNDFIQLKGLGFTSTLEMLVKLKILGAKFTEVPFVLRYDQKESESKMVSSVTTLGYLLMAVLYHWPFGGWRTGFIYRRANLVKKERLLRGQLGAPKSEAKKPASFQVI